MDKSNITELYPCLLIERDNKGKKMSFHIKIDVSKVDKDYEPIFEDENNYSNGHSWGKLIKVLIEEKAPDFKDGIDLDCEADTFFAHVANKELLYFYGNLISKMCQNENELRCFLKKITPT